MRRRRRAACRSRAAVAGHNHRRVAAEEAARIHLPVAAAVVVAVVSIRLPEAWKEADCLRAVAAAAANQTSMSSLRHAGGTGTYLATTADPGLNRARISQSEHDS